MYFLLCSYLFVAFLIEAAAEGTAVGILVLLWPLLGIFGLISYFLYETGSRQWKLIVPMMAAGVIAALPAVVVMPIFFSIVLFGSYSSLGLTSLVPCLLLSSVPLILVFKAFSIFYSLWKQKKKQGE